MSVPLVIEEGDSVERSVETELLRVGIERVLGHLDCVWEVETECEATEEMSEVTDCELGGNGCGTGGLKIVESGCCSATGCC